MKPVVEMHRGIMVVRDDLFEGGTKARYIGRLFDDSEEVVYATPAQGGAQSALALVARNLSKRATLFVAKRNTPHRRTLLAKEWGATVYQVKPGHLNVVQARARQYALDKGAKLAPFGFHVDGAVEAIAAAAISLDVKPARVWCAAGSGTLAQGLAMAWPEAELHLVQVGRSVDMAVFAGRAIKHVCRVPFDKEEPAYFIPVDCDLHYDGKAWNMCAEFEAHRQDDKPVLFWNVTGPA